MTSIVNDEALITNGANSKMSDFVRVPARRQPKYAAAGPPIALSGRGTAAQLRSLTQMLSGGPGNGDHQ